MDEGASKKSRLRSAIIQEGAIKSYHVTVSVAASGLLAASTEAEERIVPFAD